MSEFTQYVGLTNDLAATVDHYEQLGSNPTGQRITDHDIRRLVERIHLDGQRVGKLKQQKRTDRFLTFVDSVMVLIGAVYLVSVIPALIIWSWEPIRFSDVPLWIVWGTLIYLNFFTPQRSNTQSLYRMIRSKWSKEDTVSSESETTVAERD